MIFKNIKLMETVIKIKNLLIIFLITLIPSLGFSADFTLDCRSLFEKLEMSLDSKQNGIITGGDDFKHILIMNETCTIKEIRADRVNLLCPFLDITDDNPQGLGLVQFKKESVFDNKGALIILGRRLGTCDTVKITKY